MIDSKDIPKLGPAIREAIPAAEMIAAHDLAVRLGATAPRRTGALARSFRVEESKAGAQVVSTEPYARVVSEGGAVRPQRGRFLAVPLPGAGVGGASPRELGRLVVIPRKGGGPLLAKRDGRQIRPLFALVKSVQVRGTGYVDRALETGAEPAGEAVAARLERALEEV